MQKILIATDFSERSDRALRRAVLLARAHGALLDLVHVVDDDRPRRLVDHEVADARDILRQQVATLQEVDGLRCESEVILADPFKGILHASKMRQPDLVVLGPHRRQFLHDSFVGTTAERAIRKLTCPVLTVNGPPAGPWRHVLLTTDLSGPSRSALHRYLALAPEPQARHSLLHVFEVLALRLTMSDALGAADRDHLIAAQAAEARQDLRTFAEGLGSPGLATMVRHRATTEAAEILAGASQVSADLVVMAAQGKGALARLFLGSVTEKVLQMSPVDVLTLPPGPDPAPVAGPAI